MLSGEAQIKVNQIPRGWTFASVDFINQMLRRKENERLGYRGIEEVKSHQWLKDIDWSAMGRKVMESPISPDLSRNNFDTISSSS